EIIEGSAEIKLTSRVEVKPGWQVKVGRHRRTITKATRGLTYRVDKIWTADICQQPAELMQPQIPVLKYRQGCGAYWFNQTLPQNTANIARLKALGILLASTLSNQCRLNVALPEVFFSMLVASEDATPSKTDLASLD
ncbi:unnamed protein product, partial [Chrysoparadoxa australica]